MKQDEAQPTIRTEEPESGVLRFTISGRLDAGTTGEVWRTVMQALDRFSPRHAVVESSAIDYCDISGVGLFIGIGRRQQRQNHTFQVIGLREEFRQLLDLFDVDKLETEKPPGENFFEGVGKTANEIWKDIRDLIAFLGSLTVSLAGAARGPRSVRWEDALRVAENAGVNALPIVGLVSFLVGLIMAFQSAIPMAQFGAQIYVANLVALSMLRELGPLMTALILAGRTGSAFAAELGTMKVNEEIDALITMGLDPVQFLAVTRVIATFIMTPLLAIFADVVGVFGGAIVLMSMGFSPETYYYQVVYAATYVDFLGGIFKCFAFGLIIAGVGCARGLQTRIGAAAVGESATRSVVSGIILIIVADGTFAVIYYFLGI